MVPLQNGSSTLKETRNVGMLLGRETRSMCEHHFVVVNQAEKEGRVLLCLKCGIVRIEHYPSIPTFSVPILPIRAKS